MPAYGVEAYISQAIESVLAQMFTNWELIVVDDGSLDQSYEIAERYAQADSRIRVVRKHNGGLSSARNFGLYYARGKYIHFFDPDDYIEPYFYHVLLGDSNNADIVIGGYKVRHISEGYDTLQTEDCNTATLADDCTRWVCYAWNKLFRRSFLIDNNLTYEEGLSRIEDAEFMSRVVAYMPQVAFTRQSGYVYVDRSAPTLSKGYDKKIIDINLRRIDIDVKLIEFFAPNRNEADVIDSLKTRATISTINRLYSVHKDSSSAFRHTELRKIQQLLPSKIRSCRLTILRRFFDHIMILALRTNQFWIIETLQKFR